MIRATGVDHEVVIEIVGVGHVLQQSAAWIESDFDLSPIVYPRPRHGA
jgi:hypothetical protein